MTITAIFPRTTTPGTRTLDALAALLSGLAYQARTGRARAEMLPDRLLRDAGIAPADAEDFLRKDVAPSVEALRHCRL